MDINSMKEKGNVMMQDYQHAFFSYLEAYKREETLCYALNLLDSGSATVPQLYEHVIAPALDSITICRSEEKDKIWREHVMTGIARTVVECCFPYVLKQKNPETLHNSEHTVAVLCPEEEYHDIGARMGADYFTMENYNVVFVGGNTPQSNIMSLCKDIHPKWLAISVSNFYHLAAVKDVISQLQDLPQAPGVILSGSALTTAQIDAQKFGAFAVVQTYEQVRELGGAQV